jgi:hypothetical protein
LYESQVIKFDHVQLPLLLLALIKRCHHTKSVVNQRQVITTHKPQKVSDMSEVPQVLGIILCERVLQDVLRRDAISCINIHNGMTVQDFPAVVPLVFAFAQVSGSHHEFNYQFKMVDRQGQVIAISPVAKVEPLPNRYMTHKIISAFSGLMFREEGMYTVVLSLDGAEVGSLPFQVLQVPAEGQQQAPAPGQ